MSTQPCKRCGVEKNLQTEYRTPRCKICLTCKARNARTRDCKMCQRSFFGRDTKCMTCIAAQTSLAKSKNSQKGTQCEACGKTGTKKQMQVNCCHETARFVGTLCKKCGGAAKYVRTSKHALKLYLYLKSFDLRSDTVLPTVVADAEIRTGTWKTTEPRICTCCNTVKPRDQFTYPKLTCIPCVATSYVERTCMYCDHTYMSSASRGCRECNRCRTKALKLTKKMRDDNITSLSCASCGITPAKVHVDHEHSTNKFRGMLCKKCNSGCLESENELLAMRNLFTYHQTKELEYAGQDIVNDMHVAIVNNIESEPEVVVPEHLSLDDLLAYVSGSDSETETDLCEEQMPMPFGYEDDMAFMSGLMDNLNIQIGE